MKTTVSLNKFHKFSNKNEFIILENLKMHSKEKLKTAKSFSNLFNGVKNSD